MNTALAEPLTVNKSSAMRISALAILSMLHEEPERNSATRDFRTKPILAWTLDRLACSDRLSGAVVLCWDDQARAVSEIIEGRAASLVSRGTRESLPNVEAVTASRAWAEGWRGGLNGACDFDLGFHAPYVRDVLIQSNAEAAILVDPSAALVDPALIDRLIERAGDFGHVDLHFTQAAPGLCGTLLRRATIERFATTRMHAGLALTYLPDHAVRDPIGGEGCLPLSTSLTRSSHSFKLNSDRQINRITRAVESMNGSLADAGAEEIAQRMQWPSEAEPLPRDVTLELTTRRESRPINWPGRYLHLHRPDMPLDVATKLFDELGRCDDIRLTLAGVGDPLLHPAVFDLIALAKARGVKSIHVETDLLCEPATAGRLAATTVEIVSVHLPAVTPATYSAVMGVDGYAKVLANITAFAKMRASAGRLTPLIAPTFFKCRENLAELEPWYDGWLKAVGSAVISGPSDFAGQIPGIALADMSPPRRIACARIASRCAIHCDGTVVSCEQNVLSVRPLGNIRESTLSDIWTKQFHPLRVLNSCGQWDEHPLCGKCTEWHRP